MSVVFTFPIDEVRLAEVLADSWTHIELFYSNTPDGGYQTSGVRAALVAGTYSYELSFAAGSPSYWYKVALWDGGDNSDLNDASPFHGGGGTTLGTLRQLLGKRVKDATPGTTTSAGDTTSAVCSNVELARFPDDHFISQFFQRLDTGEWTAITDWVKSTTTLTLSPAIASVGSGVDFLVTKRWTPNEYRDAINWAIANSYPTLNRWIIYTGHRTQAAGDPKIYEFDVPNDIRTVAQLEIENDPALATSATAADRGRPWRDIPYQPLRSGLMRKVELQVAQPDDRRLRMTGLGMLQQLYNESDYVELQMPDLNLIIDLAAAYLYQLLPNTAASTDIDRYQELAKFHMSMYDIHKKAFGSGQPAKTIWSPAAQSMRGGRQRRGLPGGWGWDD